MEVYGLTGGIGSGKSTVATMLEEYGVPVVSADELSRMVVAPGSEGLRDVVEAFGDEVLDEHGELDRKKMGAIVFRTTDRRRQLEAILHPRIRERYEQVLDALEKAGHPVMVYEVPLLFEKKLDEGDEMSAVILVTATADTRIARVKARDSLTTDDVLARMRAQMPEQDKRQRANYIIHNDGGIDDLRREVEYLLSRFLRIPPRAPSATPELAPLLADAEPSKPAQKPELVQTATTEPSQDEASDTLEIQVGAADPASTPAQGLQVELVSNPDSSALRRAVPPPRPASLPKPKPAGPKLPLPPSTKAAAFGSQAPKPPPPKVEPAAPKVPPEIPGQD